MRVPYKHSFAVFEDTIGCITPVKLFLVQAQAERFVNDHYDRNYFIVHYRMGERIS